MQFHGRGPLGTPVYRREELPAGARLSGPAVVEELDSTTLVLPGQELVVLADGILRLSGAPARSAEARRGVDSVTMSVIGDQLVQIAQEMGTHMMRAAYSPIFSESRDFSCALFDGRGRMIAQGRFNPAHLGAIGETVRCVLDELGAASFAPGDVVIHNDPYRGGCHMPEHMLLRPVFHSGELVAFAATIGHMAEIGAVTVGSFASTATEVYQEGLRLPPVKLVSAGEPVVDVWKIILSNHRTPRLSWGDLHAMIGSLELAERRLRSLLDRHGAPLALAVWEELLEHGERLMRRRIEAIPDGEYVFEDAMEGDGHTRGPVTMRVRVVVRGDRAIVDYTGSDPQARGPVNATYGVTLSATCNAFLQVSGTEIPRNAGTYRCMKTIAPPGSVVNVRFPGPSVGGNTETQPKLVGMLLGALAGAMPEKVMAAEGATACNFLFGGVDPRTQEPYAHYHFEASGWGGRAGGDGESARNHIHGNCRNTPVEVFETRFPFRTLSYGLVADSGGPGRRRGGLAVRRDLEVLAPQVTVSAFFDRVERGAWGLFGGRPGRCAALLVRRAGDDRFRDFCEAFGTASPSKLSGVSLRAGDVVRIESAGGGGFGDPRAREPELVLRDVARRARQRPRSREVLRRRLDGGRLRGRRGPDCRAPHPRLIAGRTRPPTPPRSLDLEDPLDLDRYRERQSAHAHGGARVRASLGPEHLDQKVRGSVRHRRLLTELRVGVDEHEQLHDALHAVELADLGLQARKQVHDRQPGRCLAGRDVDLATELPRVDELAVLVGPVPRDEDDAANGDRADIAADRGVGCRKLVAELHQALFGGHLRAPWSLGEVASEACRGPRRARRRPRGRRGAQRPRRGGSCSRTRDWG